MFRRLSWCWFAILSGLLVFSSASAQQIGGTRTGAQLVTFLRANFRPTTQLSYDTARQRMFSQIDNRNGRVRCVYTGVEIATTGIPDDRVMNAEHTWPQSKFNERLPMRADLHHLFPTLNKPNGVRANFPFAEIRDQDTDGWWLSNTKQTTRPQPGVINQFSESASNRFEPREDHKGNCARAMFYFWVVYGNDNVTPSFINSQKNTLAAWHAADPTDAAELARNTKIKAFQGNDNPFVLDRTLVGRILQGGPNPAFALAAEGASPGDEVVADDFQSVEAAAQAMREAQAYVASASSTCCWSRRDYRRARRCR